MQYSHIYMLLLLMSKFYFLGRSHRRDLDLSHFLGIGKLLLGGFGEDEA